MIEFNRKEYFTLVVDQTTYHQNETAIDQVILKNGGKNHFLGLDYVEGYQEQVFVWLFPYSPENLKATWNRVQALSDDITYVCMEQDVA